jgi:hypothetical protein
MSNFKLFRLCVLLFTILVCCQSRAQDKPYLITSQILDFGELLGLTGTCHLDFDTKELTDMGGNLCPFNYQSYGEPARYIVVTDPGSQVEFRMVGLFSTSEGLSYVPEGVYVVSDLPDVPILVNQFQTIDSGDTGIINIHIGGTLTTLSAQSFNSNFLIYIEDGISFEAVP